MKALLSSFTRRWRNFGRTEDDCGSWFHAPDGDDRDAEIVRSLTSGGILEGHENVARHLVGAGELVCFAKGETLVEKGAGDTDVYFVVHGRVTVERGKDGPIDRVAPVTIGEMAAMNPGKPRSAKVWARVGDVATLKVSAKEFTNVLSEHPMIADRLNMDLSKRFYALLEFVHELEGHLRTRNSRYFWPVSLALSFTAGFAAWIYVRSLDVSPALALPAGVIGGLSILYAAVVLNPAYRFSRLLSVIVFGWLAVNAVPTIAASLQSEGLKVEFASPEIGFSANLVTLGLAIIFGLLVYHKE